MDWIDIKMLIDIAREAGLSVDEGTSQTIKEYADRVHTGDCGNLPGGVVIPHRTNVVKLALVSPNRVLSPNRVQCVYVEMAFSSRGNFTLCALSLTTWSSALTIETRLPDRRGTLDNWETVYREFLSDVRNIFGLPPLATPSSTLSIGSEHG